MKINTAFAATLAGLALAAIALTGCTQTDDSMDDGFNNPTPEARALYTTQFDQSTGRIVKITEGWSDSGEDVQQPDTILYADPALETLDPALLVESTSDWAPMTESAPGGYTASSDENAYIYGFEELVETTVKINGKSYPVNTRVSGFVSFNTVEEGVVYYNDTIAQPMDSSVPTPPRTLAESLKAHAKSEAATQVLANVAYEPQGSSTIKQNANLAQDAANGMPTWLAYRTYVGSDAGQQNSNPGSSDTSNQAVQGTTAYAYSYACASYEVVLMEPGWTKATMDAALNERIDITSLDSMTSKVLVDTAEPCTVIRYTATDE